MRWLSPVQSATRFCMREVEIGGVRLPCGAAVNCMLGAANRDEAAFERADRFELARANASRHLGFVVGPHLCIGRHLARAEANAAITAVLRRLPNLRMEQDVRPEGHEFRQPKSLPVSWHA